MAKFCSVQFYSSPRTPGGCCSAPPAVRGTPRQPSEQLVVQGHLAAQALETSWQAEVFHSPRFLQETHGGVTKERDVNSSCLQGL